MAAVIPRQSLAEVLKPVVKNKMDTSMDVWDKGVFMNELLKQGLVLTDDDNATLAAKGRLAKGTYYGTKLALTEIHNMSVEATSSNFDTRGFDPIFPTKRELEDKRKVYQWSGPDTFPPHLAVVPPSEQPSPDDPIFNPTQAGYVTAIAQAFSFTIPQTIEHRGTPYEGPTIADTEKYNSAHPSGDTDIMKGTNIGDKVDWYSDARFAQQHLSGVNPCTIEKAPPQKIKEFVNEAGKQGLGAMKDLLLHAKDLLIQDYSYFRQATGVRDGDDFKNTIVEPGPSAGTPGATVYRYACAPVVIFQLHPSGRLHPLAITIDYKGSMDKSVTIFNRRLTPDAKGPVAETDDWPWRYAKTCAQTADWARHEVAVHLVETHMIEEAIIVATNRTVPEKHLLYEILSPHWYKTLPLNEAARKLLVPGVITRLAGFGIDAASGVSQTMRLINYSYRNFNFQEKYIPNDLKKRGFDLDTEEGDKYRNYPYATDMYLLWGVLRDFVKTVLGTKYKNDADVRADGCIADWCKEIQQYGEITTFPTIKTLDQLIDAVTMCIHIASPQHTAVNYLQNYYYNYVPSKPPSLCTPLPADLASLQKYMEKELTDALPIGTAGPKWKDWLLAAQLPELLSYKVEAKYNLLNYAKSLYNVNKSRTVLENRQYNSEAIRDAAEILHSRLVELEGIFKDVSAHQTEGTIEYKVLQPEVTAVSILI